jgi:hypothetical protein
MVEVIQYNRRTMLRALEIASTTTTFLQDLLVKDTIQHDSKFIEIDIVKGGNTVVGYASRVDPVGELVNKPDYSSKLHTLPYTKQRMVLTSENLEKRLPGQTIYSNTSKQQAMAFLVGWWLGELDKRIIRKEEIMLAEALINGTQTISEPGNEYTITYGRDSGNNVTLTAGDRWSQATTRDIRGDFRAAQVQMAAPGVDGGGYSHVILGPNAAANYSNDLGVKEVLDIRKYNAGEIDFKVRRAQRATYIGRHTDIEVDCEVWSYSGQYKDSSGTNQYYIGTNDALFINADMRVDKHYGPIYNLNKGTFEGSRYPSQWTSEDGSNMTLQLESSPLPATHEPNGCYRLATNG